LERGGVGGLEEKKMEEAGGGGGRGALRTAGVEEGGGPL